MATKDTTVSPINNDTDEARKGHNELGYTSSAVAKYGTIYLCCDIVKQLTLFCIYKVAFII